VSPYDQLLFQAMLLTAFFGLLRLSEYVGRYALLLSDISVSNSEVVLVFRNFKFKQDHLPVSLRLPAVGGEFCPVAVMSAYLVLRRAISGSRDQLFVFASGLPVSSRFFVGWFRRCVRAALPSDRAAKIRSHSLRIGGATDAMLRGLSELQVQHLGRWRSNAFLRYIRPYMLPS
jgi:hypothetical protein